MSANNFKLCSDNICHLNCTTVPSGVCTYYNDKYFLGTFVDNNKWLNLTAFSDGLCSNNLTNTPMLSVPTAGCGSFGKEYNITIGFTSDSTKTNVNAMFAIISILIASLFFKRSIL
ncbi:hypothetical protein DM01DRAFT_1053567 [Hesseltinella vesiculosa]|uniref:Uncharacterized protein n=1 Tax=Hesseltinella vesiculosa TaxID=101127 RepID=A0A1X2GGP0_9FUNG|nr:hypothetical protein DM01DRAFT_1053567 [Hesseltinella vesiculosa]